MTDVDKQYARAVFSLALERSEEVSLYDDMKDFVNSLDKETWKFFLHPKIDKVNKHAVIEKVVSNLLLANFVKVLIDNNRFDLLENVIYAYLDLLNEMNKIVEVKILSNQPLTKDNLQRVIKSLEKRLMKKINMTEEIDEKIVGGIRIEYEGNIIDQTINSSLESIKASLLGGN
jgi:F-type H+-transporting ATPase subunit delta